MAGDIKKAGEWSLEFMELTASSGRKVRLDDAFIGITFIEDINNKFSMDLRVYFLPCP